MRRVPCMRRSTARAAIPRNSYRRYAAPIVPYADVHERFIASPRSGMVSHVNDEADLLHGSFHALFIVPFDFYTSYGHPHRGDDLVRRSDGDLRADNVEYRRGGGKRACR